MSVKLENNFVLQIENGRKERKFIKVKTDRKRYGMQKMFLFVIPFAGGSSLSFPKTQKEGKTDFQVVLLDTPGKGRRHNEKLPVMFDELVTDIFKQIQSCMQKNKSDSFVVLGHSMGSYIAYEVVKKLNNTAGPKPCKIYISGSVAPGRLDSNEIRRIFRKGDESIIDYIASFGAMSKELMMKPFVRRSYLPVVCADYKMLVEYNDRKHEGNINIPSVVISGRNDQVEISNVYEWSKFFSLKPEFMWKDGGHFFILEKWKEILEYIYKNKLQEI